MNWNKAIWLGILTALPLVALDRDFRAIGDGDEAPAELTLYRRAKGYTILVGTDGRPAQVTVAKEGKTVFTLQTEDGMISLPDGKKSPATPVSHDKRLPGWFIPDALSGVNQDDLLDAVATYDSGTARLPDSIGGPLRISGRKGPHYNWNIEENTLLEQVSNTQVTFSDFPYDIADAGVADLVSGSAEIIDDTLRLKAVLREPASCVIRVLLDTIPQVGYQADGTDFMLENSALSRFTGTTPKEWQWDKLEPVTFQQDGTTYTWSVPLQAIRPDTAGRMRIRFQTKNAAGTDEMPSYGKIFPILRPGNLAADPATHITVSSCAPMYKTYPLTDGQTSRSIHWCFESWATANADPNKFVQFTFATPVPLHQILVWWEELPKAAEIQILTTSGEWRTVMSQTSNSQGSASDWVQSEIGAAIVEPNREKLKQAQKNIFPFPAGTVSSAVRITDPKELWIREIEIY